MGRAGQRHQTCRAVDLPEVYKRWEPWSGGGSWEARSQGDLVLRRGEKNVMAVY